MTDIESGAITVEWMSIRTFATKLPIGTFWGYKPSYLNSEP
jgi:hypothetical protein